MLGPEGTALAIAALLEAALPDKLTELMARLSPTRLTRLEREQLTPAIITPFEVVDLPVDAYPAVMVDVQELVGFRRVDVDDDDLAYAGQPIYRSSYRTVVFTYARGRVGNEDPAQRGQEADLVRKRLVLAVREVLLSSPAFRVTIGADPDDLEGHPGETVFGTLDESTLRESYSPTVEDDASTLAGAATTIVAGVDEVIPLRTPAIPVDTVDTVVGSPIPDA